jgi:hypothetical protein
VPVGIVDAADQLPRFCASAVPVIADAARAHTKAMDSPCARLRHRPAYFDINFLPWSASIFVTDITTHLGQITQLDRLLVSASTGSLAALRVVSAQPQMQHTTHRGNGHFGSTTSFSFARTRGNYFCTAAI